MPPQSRYSDAAGPVTFSSLNPKIIPRGEIRQENLSIKRVTKHFPEFCRYGTVGLSDGSRAAYAIRPTAPRRAA